MPATASATRPVAVKLDQGILDRIHRLSVARHRSAHWLKREAVRQYIESEEKRGAYRQDGIRAWNDYQATGLHVTLEEADDWLGKLKAGQDAEPPECHA
jgi:predicted transcriptional regulator